MNAIGITRLITFNLNRGPMTGMDSLAKRIRPDRSKMRWGERASDKLSIETTNSISKLLGRSIGDTPSHIPPLTLRRRITAAQLYQIAIQRRACRNCGHYTPLIARAQSVFGVFWTRTTYLTLRVSPTGGTSGGQGYRYSPPVEEISGFRECHSESRREVGRLGPWGLDFVIRHVRYEPRISASRSPDDVP